MKKRLCSILVSTVLIFNLMPITATASDPGDVQDSGSPVLEQGEQPEGADASQGDSQQNGEATAVAETEPEPEVADGTPETGEANQSEGGDGNGGSSKSDPVVTITQQPQDITCEYGDPCSVSVVASTDPEKYTLQYQWYYTSDNSTCKSKRVIVQGGTCVLQPR